MGMTRIVDGLYMLPGLVNVYLLATPDGYALIDTGFPGSAEKILKGLKSVHVAPAEVRHMVLTHAHPDHIGSAGALKQATGATVYAHAEDAPIIKAGTGFRGVVATPRLRNRIMTKILSGRVMKVDATPVDHLLADGQSLPFDENLVAVHIPGHCLGQIALLWKKHGGVLLTADACINRGGMKLTAAVEDEELTRLSLAKLAGLDFGIACFGHGKPIFVDAHKQFKRMWLPSGANGSKSA